MYKNNQKYCKRSYFSVDVQGVTGSSPVSATTTAKPCIHSTAMDTGVCFTSIMAVLVVAWSLFRDAEFPRITFNGPHTGSLSSAAASSIRSASVCPL